MDAERGGGDGVIYYDNGLIDDDHVTNRNPDQILNRISDEIPGRIPDFPKYLKDLLLKSTLSRNKETGRNRFLREITRYYERKISKESVRTIHLNEYFEMLRCVYGYEPKSMFPQLSHV